MKLIVNPFETFFYFSFWTLVVMWSFFSYYKAQIDIFKRNPYLKLSLRDLAPGWSFLNRERDISDVEWGCWKYYIQTLWPYLIAQFMISEFLRKLSKPMIVKLWYFSSTVYFLLFYMGVKQLLGVIIQPIVYFILLCCGGKKVSIWITSLFFLSCYNSLKYQYYFWQYLDDGSNNEEKIFLLLFALAWIELRCISYCLDYIERQEEKNDMKENVLHIFINMFSYVMYLPLLYLGPVMLYEEFENSFLYKSEKLWTRIKRFTLDITLFLAYAFLLELAFHYLYFHALHGEIRHVKELPTIALAGGGLWMGFQFHTKYVISYGSTTAFARLDNMDAPPTPRCIARVHVYSQMWRYFDVGLYKFLVKYIYRPSYSMLSKYMNTSKTFYKLIASSFTFAFIFLWHGTAMHIFIWSMLNYTGILLEHTAKALSTTDWYKNFKQNVLRSDAMEVRFIAMLCAPLLAISAVSNFYLFGGTEVGNIYMSLLEWPSPHNVLLVLIATYCCSHVSMTLSDVPSRTDVKRMRVKIE